MTNVAGVVAAESRKFSADTDAGLLNWDALLSLMHSCCKFLQPRKLHGKSFDLLKDISVFPAVFALEAVDGGTQHAVAVVGNLIFDSNCERPLPLTRQSLDYCCSTDTQDGLFKNIFRGYRFEGYRSDKKHAHLFRQFADKCVEIDMILLTPMKDEEEESNEEDEKSEGEESIEEEE
jgi:hypothetical protein